MIKIYFGPYMHSPAPEIAGNERTLWLTDFHALRGYDQDFWTNNPLMLDVFELEQIYVWQHDWVKLVDVANALMPDRHDDPTLRGLCPGRLALACELLLRGLVVNREDGSNGEIDGS